MGNSRSFFDGLGEALNKTAKVLSDRASSVYESSKIRSKINAEERSVEKMKNDIGDLIFSRYKGGEKFEGEIGQLCEEINERNHMIAKLESEIAGVHGRKICSFCGKQIPADAVFCPSCGAELPEAEEIEGTSEEEDVQQSGYEEIEESEAEGADESSFDSEPEMVDLVSEAGEEMAEVAESAFDDEGMMKSAHEAAKAVLDEGEV